MSDATTKNKSLCCRINAAAACQWYIWLSFLVLLSTQRGYSYFSETLFKLPVW